MFFLSRSHEDRFLLFREAIKLHSSIFKFIASRWHQKLTADTRQFTQVDEWQKEQKQLEVKIKLKRREIWFDAKTKTTKKKK